MRKPTTRKAPAQRSEAPEVDRAVCGVHTWAGLTQLGIPWEIRRGDAEKVLAQLGQNQFQCIVTSPPYYSQRDYGVTGQIGLESSIEKYVDRITAVMDQLKRVLHSSGVLFLNLGDTYYSGKGEPKGKDSKNSARRFGLRPVDASGLGVARKTAIGIPWRVALRMIDDGWTLRCPIIWQRDGTPPEPTAHDRPWRTHEMIFMFTKSPRYHFNRKALNGDEDIWNISARPNHARGIHSAAFPEELVRRCLEVGCPEGGTVLDPFAGCGTVVQVAATSGHPVTGIDLSEEFCRHMEKTMRKL